VVVVKRPRFVFVASVDKDEPVFHRSRCTRPDGVVVFVCGGRFERRPLFQAHLRLEHAERFASPCSGCFEVDGSDPAEAAAVELVAS
jgi:hypothetical protein